MNKKLILISLCSGLLAASCALGPTAFLADGSKVSLGGSALMEADADARQANMPNGLALNWVRTKVNETGVAKAGLGAWGVVRAADALQKTAQAAIAGKTAQTGINANAGLGQTALKSPAVVPGGTITAPGVTIAPPAPVVP